MSSSDHVVPKEPVEGTRKRDRSEYNRQEPLKPFWTLITDTLAQLCIVPVQIMAKKPTISWFTTKQQTAVHMTKTRMLCELLSMSESSLPTTEEKPLKIHVIRILPNEKQRKRFDEWMDAHLYIYNKTVTLLKEDKYKPCDDRKKDWFEYRPPL